MQSEHREPSHFFKEIFKSSEAKILDSLLALIESKQGLESKALCNQVCDKTLTLFHQGLHFSHHASLKMKALEFHMGIYTKSPEEFIAEVKQLVIEYKTVLPNKGEVNLTSLRY